MNNSGIGLRNDIEYNGFDNSTGNTWIYPVNYPKREYQYSISKKALNENTLVVLPTGLGKTFIAAVVMYNFYRWYPKCKVIFMAPTRPLTAQQINASYEIMGIPKEDTVEITGRISKANRRELWKTKRVFYATPQAVLSDLLSPEHEFPIDEIRLIVVDEAHKAKGKYAYTEVIRLISERNKFFRVLALSATPGRDLKDVKEIVQNLLISHIEVRYETSLDVAPYTFKKLIKTEVVKFDSRIKRVRTALIEIMEPYVDILKDANLLTGNTGSHSKGWILNKQKEFRQLALIDRPPNYSELTSSFSTCVSLYHSLEVLERHGCRMFLNSFVDDNNRTGFKYFVNENHHLKELLEQLKTDLGVRNIALDRSLNQSVNEDPNFDYGHPKFKVLEQKLLEHFSEEPSSKVMIFCELRETVMLIDILLSQHKPLIRSRKLVGQGSSTGIKAVTQKEQLQILEDFKKGRSNCLIATCVAEEGIDVGDLMMIVCFDSTTNPTRYVQRIGRTGRKQQGKVLMLCAEGREHDNLKKVLNQKDKINQKLSSKKDIEWFLYKNAPKLIPPSFKPECLEVCFEIKGAEPKEGPSKSNKRTITNKKENQAKTTNKGKKKTKAIPGGQDMRNFFKPLDSAHNSSIILDSTQPEFESMHYGSTKNVSSSKNMTISSPKNYSTLLDFSSNFSFSTEKQYSTSTKDETKWEKLRKIQNQMKKAKKSNNTKNMKYATDLAVLNYKKISKLKTLQIFLLTKHDNVNIKIQEIRKKMKTIIKFAKENIYDKKRLTEIFETIKNVEILLNNQEIIEINSEKLNENTDNNYLEKDEYKSYDNGFSFTQFVEQTQYIESKYYVPPTDDQQKMLTAEKLETPLYEAFNSDMWKIPAESTPVRPMSRTCSNRIVLKSPKVLNTIIINSQKKREEKQKMNEQEILNSLGLNSIDDLFADYECGQKWDSEDENLNVELSPKAVESAETNQIISKKRSRDENTSPVPNESKKKRPKLEFVDLDNILGISDDDLFDEGGDSEPENGQIETINKKSETVQEPLKSNNESQHNDSIDYTEVPDEILSKELKKLNSSLKGLLGDDLFDLFDSPFTQQQQSQKNDCETPKSSKKLSFGSIPVPELQPSTSKVVVEALEALKKSPHKINEKCKTPNKYQTSPSLLANAYKLKRKPVIENQLAQIDKIISPKALCKVESKNSTVQSPFTQIIGPVRRNNKRIRMISSDSEDEQENQVKISKQKQPKKRKRPRNWCAFLDTEAGVSGDDSQDEADLTAFSQLDSFVVDNSETFDETNADVNMYAKYVQSIKSPRVRRGFKIPEQLKPFNRSEIFSQIVPIQASQYDLNDSFVVENVEDEEVEELSELEKAELILEAERKAKRRNRWNNFS